MSMLLRPHLLVRRLTDIDPRALVQQGVRGLVLDLDNTLAPWRSVLVPSEVVAWVADVKEAGLLATIVSNAASDGRVRPVASQLGIPYVVRAAKPLAGGFMKAMKLMRTDPVGTAVLGDQLFTDVLGGNRLGLYTILVDPLSQREALITRLLQRPLERLVGRVQRPAPGTPSAAKAPFWKR
jgi:uncharacterized protein